MPQQSFEDVDCGRERGAEGTVLLFAVPPALTTLLVEQAGDHVIYTRSK
jgi:hypothetical protein